MKKLAGKVAPGAGGSCVYAKAYFKIGEESSADINLSKD
jgi:hypothetical protein